MYYENKSYIDDDEWWWVVFVVWLTNERHLALFPPGRLSEILTIANVRHPATRIWTCTEPEFRLSGMKLCSSDNCYTVAPHGENNSWSPKIFATVVGLGMLDTLAFSWIIYDWFNWFLTNILTNKNTKTGKDDGLQNKEIWGVGLSIEWGPKQFVVEGSGNLRPLCILWLPQGDSLLFTTKSPGVINAHFINLGRIKGWVDLRATRWFWI